MFRDYFMIEYQVKRGKSVFQLCDSTDELKLRIASLKADGYTFVRHSHQLRPGEARHWEL